MATGSSKHTTPAPGYPTVRDAASLPVVDVGGFPDGDRAARQAVADAVGTACEDVGFMYVTGHGIPEPVIDAALQASRAFFATSAECKRAVERRPGTYRGHVPVMPFSEDQDSGEAYLYEAFILGPELPPDHPPGAGLCWPNLWPEEPPEFAAVLRGYCRALDRLSAYLLEAFAIALGQPDDGLLRHFLRPMTNISLLHYPERPGGETGQGANARPHYDTNALTILLPGATGGLEVKHRVRGWIPVPPRRGCFVVNIGNMMEGWSGGRFRSTMHRVHPPVGRERFSIAYFASPDYETLVRPLPGVAPETGDDPWPSLHAGRAFAAFVAGFDGEGP